MPNDFYIKKNPNIVLNKIVDVLCSAPCKVPFTPEVLYKQYNDNNKIAGVDTAK